MPHFKNPLSKVFSTLAARPELKKILANMGWLSFDRLFQLIVSFGVVIWVIRYLGPEQFGVLSFSWAFAGIFAAFATLGMGNILLRDLVKHEDSSNTLLGTAFVLLLTAGILCFLSAVVVAYVLNPTNLFIVVLVAISAFPFIFNSITTLDYWFQSKVRSKYVVVSRNLMLIIVSIVKIILMVYSAPLIYFALTSVLEVALFALGLAYFYLFNKQSFLQWKFDARVAKNLLLESWPLILAMVSYAIYMRIDQILIGQMLTMADVGVYSVAVKISEFANFVPGILVSSLIPAIILSKKKGKQLYSSRFSKLYDILLLTSGIFAVGIAVFSPWIIFILYGPDYAAAAPVLFVYAWSIVPLFLSTALGQYFVIEKLVKYSLYTSLIGAALNIILNLLLIPYFGIVGSALATLISYSISVASVVVFKETRAHGVLMLQSFNMLPRIKSFIKRFL